MEAVLPDEMIQNLKSASTSIGDGQIGQKEMH
jgi:hypothetical protein